MINQTEHALRMVAARAHGMLSVLARHGEECHREQAASISNEIADILWPDDPPYRVEAKERGE